MGSGSEAGSTGNVDPAICSANTAARFIRAIAAAYGDAPAIMLRHDDGGTLQEISFAELERRSAKLARGLISRGLGKGSRIGFIHGNGPDFAVAMFAIARAGGVAIPISTMLKAGELVRVLRQSDIAGLMMQRSLLGHDYVDRLCQALPELIAAGSSNLHISRVPYLRWITCSGPHLPASISDTEALFAGGGVSDELLAEIESEVHPTDQVIEIYTSGSMALPKGVRHDHGPFFFRADYLRKMIAPPSHAEVPCFLPMFWVGGLMMSLLPNLAAGSVTLCSEAMPTSSRSAIGSVLAKEDLAAMAGTNPPWALGMSETLGPYAYGNEFRAPGRPVCAPLDNIAERFDVRVVDQDGRHVADGDVGEIQVRGYALSPGLHKVERERFYTADGFYRTGDMGLSEGSRIHFVGRDGDMIKTAGSNVSPAEVEMEMQALEGVHAAYVAGLPDAERGQLLVAAVISRSGHGTLDFASLREQLRQRLSPYKVPRAFVQITHDEVPMLVSNKVSRRHIAELIAQRLGMETEHMSAGSIAG